MRSTLLLSFALVLVPAGVAHADPDIVVTGLDAITTAGHAVPLRTKLTHGGFLNRNVKNEPITFDALGKTLWGRTDATGFAEAAITPPEAGVFAFDARLVRDAATVGRARLFVLDPARPVAVVDVDGTISDMAEWRVPFQGGLAGTFPGAPDVLRDLARTHEIIYLTARDDRFDKNTRAFLTNQHFPDGPVIYNDLGFATAAERSQLRPKNHGEFKLGQLRALAARGVNVKLGIGNAETDGFAYEGAGIKSYLNTTKTGTGPSFRFTEYAALRHKLELDGVLPPTPKGTKIGFIAGTWKYRIDRDGEPRDGFLDVIRATDDGYDVTATETGTGDTWKAHATLQGSVFTLRRTLTTGVVGALAGAATTVELEYVATLTEADKADVEVFRLRRDDGARTRIGGGKLTRPPYFSERRVEIDRAIAEGDPAIMALDDAAIAFATPDEKVAMINVLLTFGDKPFTIGVRNLNVIPVSESRQRTILRILRSAPDAAAFDRIYYRLNKGRLFRALDGKEEQELRDLIVKHEASAQPGDWTGYARYLDTVAGTATSGRNRVDFLVDGPAVIAAVTSDIDAARESIHLSVFEWQADDIGFKLARKLIDKAKAGVKVRVLIDGKGSSTGKSEDARDLVELMRRNGVEVIVNQPPMLTNHLDHRKVLVIDGRVGYTGGMNVGEHYQVAWHDQQTRLEGPAVAKLQDAFLSRWTAEAGTPPASNEKVYPPLDEVSSGVETRIVPHLGAGVDRNVLAAYVRALATARSTVRIATPYFSDRDVVDAVCAAARRGVKVQVVLPRENDVAILERTARAYYPQLIAAGVEVYEYKGRMAHEKVAVIDGTWVTAGSSNLDARSLEFNDELNYVIVDPRLAQKVERDLFDKDLTQSERITRSTGSATGWLLRKISPWL